MKEIAAKWVGTWACAQYCGDNSGDPGKASVLEVSRTLPNATLRQIIRTTSAGDKLRLTLSNEYGETPMTVKEVHIAKAMVLTKSDIDVTTDTVVTFGGNTGVIIPSGERINSDPVEFPVNALERIAVSICFGDMPETVSCHVASRANSFVQDGNAVSQAVMDGTVNTHWFVLCNVDILSPLENKSIVVLGDSITDGYGVVDEQYSRWVDILVNNFQGNEKTRHLSEIAVINMGIGTNALLDQKNPLAAKERFPRDVLQQPGVGYMVLFIGVNDLGSAADSKRLIGAFSEVIGTAHDNGIKVYGCTITPCNAFDNVRQEINAWIRAQYGAGNLFGLLDFDEVLKDPVNPKAMQEKYKSDDIHPNIAGYRVMGEYAYSVMINDVY